MGEKQPAPCPWCQSLEMQAVSVSTLRVSFVRWFCACGTSVPDASLRRMASTLVAVAS